MFLDVRRTQAESNAFPTQQKAWDAKTDDSASGLRKIPRPSKKEGRILDWRGHLSALARWLGWVARLTRVDAPVEHRDLLRPVRLDDAVSLEEATEAPRARVAPQHAP